MGEPRNRLVRSSPQRSHLVWAVGSGGTVAVVAAVFAVAGVDDVEVLATLLFAPVFVAALVGGRNAGFAAAGAATLGYLALRFGDIGDSGAFRVAVLVVARAVCYGVVAHATPSFQRRFVGLPGVRALGDQAPRHRQAPVVASALEPAVDPPPPPAEPAYRADDLTTTDWQDPGSVVAEDHEPVGVGAGWADPPPGATGWDPPVDQAWSVSQEPVVWEDPPPASGAAPVALDQAAAGPWGAPGEEMPGSWDAPPAQVPVAGEEMPGSWDAPPAQVPVAEPVELAGSLGDEQAWAPPPPPPPPPSIQPPPPPPPATPPPPTSPPGSEVGPGDDRLGERQPEATPARFLSPPAPTVPTGWVDDATVPLGEETIPLGYTGELFLPRDLRQAGPFGSPSPRSRNGSANGAAYPPSPSASSEPPPLRQPPRRLEPTPPATVDRGPAFGGEPAETPPMSGGVDPETRLWNARYFRDRLMSARDEARPAGSPFSVVMVQVADEPFQALPYRRQVAVLRELGHQFIQARMIDHLVHLPDGAQHWFAVVLPGTDRAQAHVLERRLRSAIASYLRSRGLRLGEVQSASLTSPDDDEAMATVWASLLGPTSVG